jgi:hypothetical protein
MFQRERQSLSCATALWQQAALNPAFPFSLFFLFSLSQAFPYLYRASLSKILLQSSTSEHHIKPQLSSHHYNLLNMNSPNSNHCLDGFGSEICSSHPLIN